MKLFNTFKSASWENRDPQLRAAAVREESAPELLAKLPEIAVQDAEAVVRRAALARLSAASLLLERHRNDPDAETRGVALTRLGKILLDPAAGLAPGARLSAIGLDLPAELLERLAESAPEVEARRAALSRVTRAAFLLRRCGEEPDPAVRAELFSRIDGEDALDRIAETLRKKDKTISRQARDRAESLRLARGDRDALQRYAMGLCDTLTDWAKQLPADIEERSAQAAQQWETRRASFDAPMQLRVDAYFTRLQDALARRSQRAIEADAPPALPDAGPEAVAHTAMQGDAGYPAELPAPTLPVEPEVPAAPAGPDWSAFDQHLAEAKRAVVAQHLGEARPALQQIQKLLKKMPKPDRARRDKLAEIEAKVDELDQWQRWSGNRVRARLCDDMEALIAAGHHPDAVANRVRELQQEWAKVEAAEPGDADRTSGLAKRFRALCGRAMAPTKAYFAKRDELRGEKREVLDALLAKTQPEALAPLSVPAAIGLRRQLVEALRNLDDLEPRARTPLAKRLREGLSRIDAVLDAQREDAALARRKLIAKLRRELTHADPASALELARQAQVEWRTLPRASKEHEAALEQELAALIDPLFAKEREQRDASTQQASRLESESRRILSELSELSRGDADALSHAEGRIAALAANWKELHAVVEVPATRERAPARAGDRGRPGAGGGGRDGGRDGRRDGGRDGGRDGRRDFGRDRDARPARGNDRERAFDQAVAQVRQAQAVIATSRRGERLQALIAAAALFAEVEQDEIGAEAAEVRWSELGLDEGDRRRLAARWQQVQSLRGSASVNAAAEKSAEHWLVEAEIDAGVDSPASAQAQRRQQQMQRLATRLQGATLAAGDPREGLLAWAQLGPLDPAKRDERETRLAKLLQAWNSKG